MSVTDPYGQRMGGVWWISFRVEEQTVTFDGFLKITESGVLLLWERAGTEGDARFQAGEFFKAYGPGFWRAVTRKDLD